MKTREELDNSLIQEWWSNGERGSNGGESYEAQIREILLDIREMLKFVIKPPEDL